MANRRLSALVSFGLITGLISGCSQSRPTEPVQGVVTLDSKPLADIHVNFQPQATESGEGGVGSYGLTDAEGRFELKLSDTNAAGAAVGMHSVTLSDKQAETESDAGGDSPKSRIPAKNAGTPLTIEVKSGTKNDAKFDLSSR